MGAVFCSLIFYTVLYYCFILLCSSVLAVIEFTSCSLLICSEIGEAKKSFDDGAAQMKKGENMEMF